MYFIPYGCCNGPEDGGPVLSFVDQVPRLSKLRHVRSSTVSLVVPTERPQTAPGQHLSWRTGSTIFSPRRRLVDAPVT